MPVPTLISQLSTTPSSNSPSGSESTITNDDYLRTLSAFLAQVRDGVGITPTASITFPAGSAAAPSVTFIGDTDTGIYASAANQVAIALSGAQVVNFASTGVNVQINQPVNQIGMRITSDAGVPRLVLRDRSINAAPHVVGSLMFDAYRDVTDPSYVAGIWCTATSPAGNTGDLSIGTMTNSGPGFPTERLLINANGAVVVRSPSVGAFSIPLTASINEVGPPVLLLDTNSLSISPYLRLRRNLVDDDGLLGSEGTAGTLVSDSAVGDVVLRADNSALRFTTNVGSSSALVITPDNRIYGTGLHNNGSVSGTANQYIASQSASPAPASVSNISSLTAHKSKIIRLGNTVMVDGLVTVAATATGSASFAIPLPIASSLAAFDDLSGQIQDIESSVPQVGTIQCDFTFDRAIVVFNATTTASRLWSYHFAYEVL